MKKVSIRWRIALWNVAAFAVVLLGFGVSVYLLLRQTHYDQIDHRLEAKFHEIAQRQRRSAQQPDEWLAEIGGEWAAYFLDASGKVIAKSAGPAEGDLAAKTETAGNTLRIGSALLPTLGHVRRLAMQVPDSQPPLTLVVLYELEHVDDELLQVIRALLMTTPVVLIAAASIAYLLARKALAPVDELRRMTDEITATRLNRRLPVDNPHDELGQLAQTVNSMIARLEHSFGEIRRFTADASHELRTPLAVIRSEAELALADADDPELCRRRFASIVEECDRLTELASQLLTLCREDTGGLQRSVSLIDLSSLVTNIAVTMRPIAEAKGQQLIFAATDRVAVEADEPRLRRAIRNVLDNAVKYTPAGGHITLAIAQTRSSVELTIRDSGIGIAPEHLPHIFQRFYRVNTGQSDTGGSGLGLSIVKAVIEARHGRLEVASNLGSGTKVVLVLPVATDVAGREPHNQPENVPADHGNAVEVQSAKD